MDRWGDSTYLTFDRQVFLVTGLGDRLKEARKAKGYTLDDLQGITKIQKRYLAGIENEEYSSMPGSFYVRAFIKQYAEAVGLDADEMLALYKDNAETIESEEEERQLTTPTLTRSRSRGSSHLSEIMPKVIVALFIIVILLVVAFLWKHNVSNAPKLDVETEAPIKVEDQNKPDPNQQAGNKDDEEKAEEETAEEEPETESVQTLENISISGETSTYSLENSDAFKLEIRTIGPSWIGVMDENRAERTPGARIMQAGETVDVDASDTKQVRIRVGRPGSTEIYVNGELLEYATDAVPQNIIIDYKKEE